MKTFKDILLENKNQEVVFMNNKSKSNSNYKKLQKYNEKIAKVVSDEGSTITIKFDNGITLTNVLKSDVRYVK